MQDDQDNIYGVDLRRVKEGSRVQFDNGQEQFLQGTIRELPRERFHGQYRIETDDGEIWAVDADDVQAILKK